MSHAVAYAAKSQVRQFASIEKRIETLREFRSELDATSADRPWNKKIRKHKKAAKTTTTKVEPEKKPLVQEKKPSKTVQRRERRKRNIAQINEHFKTLLRAAVEPFT